MGMPLRTAGRWIRSHNCDPMNSIVTDHRLVRPKASGARLVTGWGAVLMVACMGLNSLVGTAWADQSIAAAAEPAVNPAAAPDHPYKLTFGLYPMQGGGLPASTGADLNLRYGYGSGNVWLGRYQADGQGTQWRGGWDRSVPLPGGWRLQPSLQLASGGFAGGSVGLERGERWVAGAGLGRTNLRPYVNLNFDPNDAWMLWAGYHPTESQSLSVLVVRDNRQNPDQQHMHLVYRGPVDDGLRLTVDVLRKTGLVDGQGIRRLGWSLGLDGTRTFVHLAWDPNVNFSSQNMWRLSTGWRF